MVVSLEDVVKTLDPVSSKMLKEISERTGKKEKDLIKDCLSALGSVVACAHRYGLTPEKVMEEGVAAVKHSRNR